MQNISFKTHAFPDVLSKKHIRYSFLLQIIGMLLLPYMVHSQCAATINGDFRATPLNGSKSINFSPNDVPGWNSTAPNGYILIRNNYDGSPPYVEVAYNSVGSAASGVYQDFDTSGYAGGSFSYSFQHYGRYRGYGSAYQAFDVVLKAGPPGGPYTEVVRAQGTGAWRNYTGSYQIPANQTKTRFLFEANRYDYYDEDGKFLMRDANNFIHLVDFKGVVEAPPVMAPAGGVCKGNTATLSASAIPGGTINWYDSTGTTLLYTGESFTTPALSSTTFYKMQQVSKSGCKSDFSEIQVNVLGEVSIENQSGNECMSRLVAKFTDVSDYTYVWYKNDVISTSPDVNRKQFYVERSGTYKVKVTDIKSGCEQTSAPITVVADEKAPVISCPANITKTTDPGKNTASIAIVDPTATDNCYGSFIFKGTRSDGLALTADYPIGKTTISWTATEYKGGSEAYVSAPCDQIITITDNSACVVKTINASFESPVITDGTKLETSIIDQNQVPGWKTTAPDGKIEFWNAQTITNARYNFSPYEGKQFVELNAYYAAGLYQDFDTSEVSSFSYSLSHRGRDGTDTMVLKAGPPGGPYTEVTRASTDNTAWKVYTGTYTIPASQKSTRFIFESVSYAGGDPAKGNLLDAIYFTANLTVPPVTGADKTVCEGSSATLNASAVSGATVNWYDATGTTLLYTGPNYTTPALSANTTYKVEQVTSSGCKSAKSDIKVAVFDKITVSLSGASKACSTTTLTATTNIRSVTSNGITINRPSFVWYKDDAVINGETKETLVVTASGKYKVNATSSLTGCDQTSDPIEVVIGDTEKPVITCPANINQTVSARTNNTTVTITDPIATDNCLTAVTFTGVRSDGLALTADFPVGKTTISWTAKDDAGNVSTSCDQTITVTKDCEAVNTINPSFESPVITDGTKLETSIIDQNQVPGWKTTAPDGKIEFWNAQTITEARYNFSPYEGDQFVELNAYVAAGLYQDFDTSEVSSFSYSLSHRGRDGTDTMVLKAGPPGGPYTEVTRASTDNTAWKVYTGTYTIPASQKSTRFIFESVSSVGGDPAKGNLLDAVHFTAKLTVPPVTGADKTVCEGSSATLNASAVSGATVNWYDAAGTTLLYTGPNYTTPALSSETTYKVEQVTSSGCKSAKSDIKVAVFDKITVSLSGASKACSTTTLTATTNIKASVTNNSVTVNDPSFVWYKDDAVINGETKETLVVTASGKYKVKATSSLTGCDQTSDPIEVVIGDTEKPVITCADNMNQGADYGKCTSNVIPTKPTATDNCSTVFTFTGIRSDALAVTDAYPLGTTTISWTAKDDAGNVSAPCDQTITITDIKKPVITCPANITQTTDAGKCTANVTITNPTATDNCLTAVTFTGVRSDALALTDAYPLGKTTISWTAKDDSGNVSTSCDQTITISDTEKPVITCAANIIQTADTGKNNANVTITNPTATDNCSTAVTFTGVRSDALALTAAYPVGKTTISWTAKDDAGNVSTSCDQTITISDTEKPVITCAANISQTADAGKCTVNVTITNPTATDNCSTAVTFTGVRSDALALTAAYPVGKTTISWTAKDDSGNVSDSCDQTITITDTEKPVITCAANISQTADAGKCTANVTITNPTATDNCSTAVTFTGVRSDALALTAAYPLGKTTISWTAKDDSGNVSTSCDQTITITDTEKPVITCAANISQTADAGKCTANVTITNPTATDNCSTAVTFTGVRSDALALTAAYPVGKTTISWTAKDDAGNVSASCDQTITISDSEKPVITCAANITQTADAGKNNANVTITNPTATDNCSTAVTFTGVRSDALALTVAYPLGKTTISWTAKDDAGNVSASCDQTITITDTEKPVITCPADVATKADDGLCTATIALIAPTVSDNSGTTLVTNNAPAAFPVGVTTVVWTATDNSGNKATCEQKVTVYSLIKATDDAVASVNGAVGGMVVNVLDNDVLNCGVAKANELKIALAGKALPSGIDFDTATGAVSVKPNTPAGTYTFDYTICNLLNSSICGTATVKIDVVAPKIETPAQTPTLVVDPKTGTTPPITSDIKINDQPVTIGTKPGDVTVTIIKAPPGFILNPDGTVTVPPNTPGGTYTIDYKVCQVSNPANCVTGSVKVTVDAPKIETP
ncbi:HYR domain-containing protein, partial [Flavobacterium sp. T12S277]|uniref:HYR domain-containing protein n=1 Tax=Flavobacterium sp. T12S277 TaxID=3402752 RepID=UPI003AE3EDED